MVGADRPMIEAYFAWQRSVLLTICAGLTAEQLALRPLPMSNLSLLGLIRHLTKVERTWLRIRVAGEDVEPVFDPALGKDYDFEHVEAAEAEAWVERLQQEWALGDAAVRDLSLEATGLDRDGQPMSLRMIYLHLIGEYARHNGHADMVRQAIDGVTGR
jgi:uncharacterized damage-inducible protein DinB